MSESHVLGSHCAQGVTESHVLGSYCAQGVTESHVLRQSLCSRCD